ncbi:MAG: hypothetical protein HC844_16995 [Tabrizicola sp.]|nr:hypothetical protein [Tabrizicola sp.]
MRLLALAIIALPSVAGAACRGDVVFDCDMGAKTVEVCLSATTLTYEFGPPGKPELTLSAPVQDAQYTPWPGIGSSIWETVMFLNDGVAYEVWYSVDRNTDEHAFTAGITVSQNEATIATLSCTPGTIVQNLSAIFDAKESVGQCWDSRERRWLSGC